jgi:hypothetical protein
MKSCWSISENMIESTEVGFWHTELRPGSSRAQLAKILL